MARWSMTWIAALVGCTSATPGAKHAAAVTYRGGDAALSRAADSAMVTIPAGRYLSGSTTSEREAAYDVYQRTAGHDGARQHRWFERERDRVRRDSEGFSIDLTPVTMAAYAEFVRDTGEPPPFIDEPTWKRQRFSQNFADEVVRFVWSGNEPPANREDHPIVLVTHDQATRYCAWRGGVVEMPRRLPTEAEFERAARGDNGSIYPWGATFDPSRLNSAVNGPGDTTSVGRYPNGASPFGLLDIAGNVFQWTSTPWPHRKGAHTVRGSAWDDWGGLGRGAAMHGRRTGIKHVIVGFRCAGPPA